VHVTPQLIVPGELVTVPEPVPVLLTVRVKVGAGEKVAVTPANAVPIVKLQVPVPEQAPLQPANTDALDDALAASNTAVPLLTEALQVPGQLTPLPLTVPDPVPASVTVTGNDAGMKLALTDCAEFIVNAQLPVPLQAPLQPAKTDADDVGVAVRVVVSPEL